MPNTPLGTSLLFILFAMVAPISIADQPKQTTEENAITIRIAGVGIGSTMDEFLSRLPMAVPGSGPNATPMRDDHFVVINNGKNQVPTAYFRFLKNAVLSIEIHYPAMAVTEIAASTPLLDQFVKRFGNPEKQWRNDNLDGGVDIYTWASDKLFVSLALHDDGTAKLYTAGTDHPKLYPPQEPKTTALGIDPVGAAKIDG
ncbi:hypothetical protein [Neorhodopirellula pilleata]|uniref:Uncharacterized protein n=1 Tax=Neorhodopirellula pilleata TaxID=2714738 RepID=A0A5C5YVE9_9BACT|nr:hypothetical protein [Neorhodopirellula pilleata]TWT78603.1 hypothetical protein Pla100_62950 [Neorhodopirellula pilleata]